MRSSRLGILVLLTLGVFLTTNCSYFNQILSRKNVVDGSTAYKDRKFEEAEQFFRTATQRDPDGATFEGRIAQLFLARTLHSMYIGDRKNTERAEQAIAEYQKTLSIDPNEQSAYKAIAGLYDNLNRSDEWQKWVEARANNESILPQHRAEALTSLAARQNSCASDISNDEKNRKAIKRDDKDAYQYVKPADEEVFKRFKECVAKGTELSEKAVSLETDTVKNADSINPEGLSNAELTARLDEIKVFESARSYRTALMMQKSRLAEMEGNEQEAANLRKEVDASREIASKLGEVTSKMQAVIDSRLAEAQAKEKEAEAQK